MKYIVEIEPGRFHGELSDTETRENAKLLTKAQAETLRYRWLAYFPKIQVHEVEAK